MLGLNFCDSHCRVSSHIFSLFGLLVVLYSGQSLAYDGSPFRRHVLPIGDGTSMAWLQFWDLGFLQNFNVSDEDTPLNIEDGAKTAVMQALVEMNVTSIGGLRLSAVEQNGMNHGNVDPDYCHAPLPLVVQMTLSTIYLCNNFAKTG